ncbi:peptidylprolyl isomerase [bacterium]|nr:peptidylprolyl isomerase [bacterium]
MTKLIYPLLFLFGISASARAQTEVMFFTNYGNFIVELNDSLAPITAGNFKDLVEQKYYDGVIFHRVIDNFMIQGGDPTGTGSGGPGYTIPDEFHPSLSNVQRTISMANSGPNTGGSQFFINLVNNTYLDYNKMPFSSRHAVFGEVTSGFDIVQTIGKVQTNSSDRPLEDVVMDSIRVYPLPEPKPIELDTFLLQGNPLSANSKFIHSGDSGSLVTLKCFDYRGNLLWSDEKVFDQFGSMRVSLEPLFYELSSGLYILHIEQAEEIKRIKIIRP